MDEAAAESDDDGPVLERADVGLGQLFDHPPVKSAVGAQLGEDLRPAHQRGRRPRFAPLQKVPGAATDFRFVGKHLKTGTSDSSQWRHNLPELATNTQLPPPTTT